MSRRTPHYSNLLLEVVDEVFIEHIFQFIGNKEDFFRIELVCKKFHRILHVEYLFEVLCLRKWRKCFVHHLPDVIMKKYYQNKYRLMFYSDNKYRFHHYTITVAHIFRNPKEIRDYDKKNGTDVENQMIQSVCLDQKISDFYSSRRFSLAFGNVTLTLERMMDENNFEDMFILEYPSMNTFCALEDPLDRSCRKIDSRFPKYHLVYHYPGENSNGFIYEENTKKPNILICDGNFYNYDYENQKTIFTQLPTTARDFDISLFNSFSNIYKFYLEYYENRVSRYHSNAGSLTFSLENVKVNFNKDCLEYNNTPIYKVINNSENNILIVNLVNHSKYLGKWSEEENSTMNCITEEFGSGQEDAYEVFGDGRRVNQGHCVFSELQLQKKLYLCSMVCMTCQNWSYYFEFKFGLENIKEFCKENKISKIHFQKPDFDGVKDIKKDLNMIRKSLNRLVNKEDIQVVFHDADFQGSKDIYDEIKIYGFVDM